MKLHFEPNLDYQHAASSFHPGDISNMGVRELTREVDSHNLHNELPMNYFGSQPAGVSEATFRDRVATSARAHLITAATLPRSGGHPAARIGARMAQDGYSAGHLARQGFGLSG